MSTLITSKDTLGILQVADAFTETWMDYDLNVTPGDIDNWSASVTLVDMAENKVTSPVLVLNHTVILAALRKVATRTTDADAESVEAAIQSLRADTREEINNEMMLLMTTHFDQYVQVAVLGDVHHV